MSAQVLSRVMVRMLFDPRFADQVYTDADTALAGLDLTADERTWARTPDRRAWQTDRFRRSRSLTSLIEELPVASARAARSAGAGALDAFFSSATFHDCIQDRGSLAGAYARWLAAGPPSRVPGVEPAAALEGAVAQIERARVTIRPSPPRGRRSRLVVPPWVVPLALPGGTTGAWQAVRAVLDAHPGGLVAAAIDPRCALPAPPSGGDTEFVVLSAAPTGVDLQHGSAGLHALLGAARTPTSAKRLQDRARRAGVSVQDARKLLSGLVDDGLLHAR